MPAEDSLPKQAEDWKSKGNEAFQRGSLEDAISCYSQGLVLCDRILATASPTEPPSGVLQIKATLLSNRAMCALKKPQNVQSLQNCIDDCTTALELPSASDVMDEKLRNKLLFRRGKGRFLLASFKSMTGGQAASVAVNDLLQEAAKDLLTVLQTDAKNSEANQLLTAIRAQHKTQQTAVTPVSKTLSALQSHYQQVKEEAGGSSSSSSALNNALHQVKVLLGMLENDLNNTAMELGRLQAISTLLDMAREQSQKSSDDTTNGADATVRHKLAVLSVQIISQCSAHPPFVRKYMVQYQKALLEVIQQTEDADVIVSSLAAWVRILLHADRDDFNKDIVGTTLIENDVLVQSCKAALQAAAATDKIIVRAVLDVLSTWTAGPERWAMIRASLSSGGSHASPHVLDPTLPVPKTQADIRQMTPHELADHRKREMDTKTRDEAWAFERSITFCQSGLLDAFLTSAVACEDHVVRREMTVVLGRILAALTDDDRIKGQVQPLLTTPKATDHGVVIEEIPEGEEVKEGLVEDDREHVSLETKMKRAVITAGLLLSKKELGAWALAGGWRDCLTEISDMIHSEDGRAMCLASEVVSGAASVEQARAVVTSLVSGGDMKKLVTHPDRDIRSGAASAVTKLGLASTGKGPQEEGDLVHMLQGACELLEDNENTGEESKTSDSNGSSNAAKKSKELKHFSSYATSSVERGVEMLTYLIANTVVKDELAAGFGANKPGLELLVQTADIPQAGESLSGFGLATIFQHLAVTNEQLRKEAFEGKQVTLEQYDEMQKLQKTEEEKERMESEKDPDTQEACDERIRKMAAANVPRALVALTEGASEHTLEQVVLALNRMAGEISVRGLLIQQGVLSVCIKIEKNEGPTETDTMKKVIRLARHTIAKILVTTNPSLLTSAQRLGSIRPLIQLIRDIRAQYLQTFEALLAVTNLAGSGEDAQNRIVSEKGIPSFHFAMFSDHDRVRTAATEAMCNMVPHPKLMDFLQQENHLGLWLAFAADYEDHYECARAATGCLAMATQHEEGIAMQLVELPNFGKLMLSLLECGRLEIMHRALALILNLVSINEVTKDAVVTEGLSVFCRAYVDNYHNKNTEEIDFPAEEQALLPVTVDLAKKIVSLTD